MRLIAYILLGLLTLLIQTQLFPFLIHQVWIPNLFLVWIVLIAAMHGRKTGLIMATIAGVIHDTIISNFFGLHIFPYLLVVYIVTVLRVHIYEEQWYISCVTVAIATLVDAMIRIAILYAIHADIEIGTYMWHLVFPTIWVNGILAIFIHYLLWRMQEKEKYIW